MDKNTGRNADVPANLLTQAAMAAPWGVAITDHKRNGKPVVFANLAFELVLRQKAGKVLGKGWRSLLGKNPERQSLAQVQEAVRRGKHCSVVLRHSRKDRSRSHSELTVAPLRNRSGDVTHLIWLQRDITSQIEREKRLVSTIAEKEERFSSYVENATEAIWRIDFDPPVPLNAPEPQQVQEIFDNGVFVEANDAAARIYGFTNGAEVVGRPLRAFMEPSNPQNVERLAEFVRNRFRMKNLISYEKDTAGVIHVAINNVSPRVKNGRVSYVWGTSLDVTKLFEIQEALKRSKQELVEQAKALEEKNAALKELIAQIELDKKDLKDRIAANVEQVLLPSLEKIRRTNAGYAYIEQHRRALEDLTSSFGRRFTRLRSIAAQRETNWILLIKGSICELT
jgi:PAS domain S-box-containing protein